MDKKASRFRGVPRDGDDQHVFNLYLHKDLFYDFKAQCVRDNTSVREKIINMIKSSLEHL